MQGNKSKGTKPEVLLAKALFSRGHRYRKNNIRIFGKPDLSFSKYKIAVFIDGEFWHGKNWDEQKDSIKSNQVYWLPKIENNIKRDHEVTLYLRSNGWTVLRFWGKDVIKNLIPCVLEIEEIIRQKQMEQNFKLSISDIDGKNYKLSDVNLDYRKEAVITHFIYNENHGVKNSYKKEAISIAKEILEYKYPGQEISSKVAEDALQYELFNNENVPFLPHKNTKFSFIDLFAGIGGFRLAMQNLGGRCVYSSEWDKDAKTTYRANFGEVPFGDITKDEIKSFIPERFDVLCAGFPCQAFSIAGYRKGFSDTRGTLFFDLEQIIEKHRPKVVFLENVKNLVSHDKGKTFKVITEILEKKLKYKVFHKVLNSMTHANVPQNRERIFIVAFDPQQVKAYNKFVFPDEIKLTRTIHDLIDNKKHDAKYYYHHNHIYYNELSRSIVSKDTVYQWRRIYVRENKSNVCPTLTANMGAGGHNVPLIKDDYGIRKLTPKECFAFQGYPMDKYILPPIADSKLYMQAGNSVTTSLVERIANQIIEVI